MLGLPWLRRKAQPSALDLLRSGGWTCGSCDRVHEGMLDLAAFAPDPWRGPSEYEENVALRVDGDFLSEDLCVMDGRHFFVRCVLDIPVHGLEQKFGFGCWGTLSRANFDTYVERFDEGAYQGCGPWFSWLCNQLSDFIDDQPEACRMHPQLDRQRPTLAVADPAHPLAMAQRDGISAERLLAIYRHYGHEPIA